jgi:hypothetical protein
MERGALSFGYFSLGKQRKATRLARAKQKGKSFYNNKEK